RKYWQRQYFACRGLRDREITCAVSKVGVCRLEMNGNRVVDARLDALFRERIAQGVAVVAPNDVDVVDVPGSRPLFRHTDGVLVEELGIPPRDLTALFRPRLEMPKFHAQDCTLYAVHPVVESFESMFVPLFLSPVAKHTACCRHVAARRRDCATFPVRTQVLPGVEAEGSDLGDRAASATVIFGSVSLGGIFDNGQPASARDLEDRIHVSGLPVQM